MGMISSWSALRSGQDVPPPGSPSPASAGEAAVEAFPAEVAVWSSGNGAPRPACRFGSVSRARKGGPPGSTSVGGSPRDQQAPSRGLAAGKLRAFHSSGFSGKFFFGS